MKQRALTKPKSRYRTTSASGMAASSASRGLNRAALDLDDVVNELDRAAHLPKIAPLREDAASLRHQVKKLRDRADGFVRA